MSSIYYCFVMYGLGYDPRSRLSLQWLVDITYSLRIFLPGIRSYAHQ